MYQNFDQIRLPNSKELLAQVNEHAELDAQRWFADEAADYLRFQTGILRKYCGNRQWITSNFMHMFGAVNPALNGNDFEIITWTHYPGARQCERRPARLPSRRRGGDVLLA